MPDEEPKPSVRDDELEPVGRDGRFLFRLVAAVILGVMVAVVVGWKLKSAASGCGAGLVRPGTSVIPPNPR